MPDEPLNELTAKVWRLTEAANAAGVQPSAVTNWLSRNQISGLEADEWLRAGKKRRYTALDVLRISLVGRLVNFGVPVEQANKLTSGVLDRVRLLTQYKNTPLDVLPSSFLGKSLAIYHDGRKFRVPEEDDLADTLLVVDLPRLASNVLAGLRKILDESDDEGGDGQ